MNTNFTTSDTKIRKAGSAKTGSHHWLMQRFTALLLLITSVWLIFVVRDISTQSIDEIIITIKHPCTLVPVSIFVIAAFYHAALGMRVVLEDYISCKSMLLFSILFIQIFTIITIVTFIVALFYLMII